MHPGIIPFCVRFAFPAQPWPHIYIRLASGIWQSGVLRQGDVKRFLVFFLSGLFSSFSAAAA
jgi:hypothetical protein